ncbi:LPXTG cell wall anchor domain-containing protein [Streptococcus infantis]|uniref:LPXTG cell wall anchor domain-containing protein n=2 Tax=Streptococcus TaxID=1301 RepID=UPI0039C278FD
MKTNKVTKLGVSLLSVAVLGVVAPVLTDESVFGISIVKAEETRPLKYTIAYYDKDTGKEIAPRKTGTINPGETVNIYKDIDGYQVVSNFDEWMPGFNATYRIVSRDFGFSDGRRFMDLSYKKVNADAKPSDTPKPEVKPETKPSETPKPEVKPEPKPSETLKPEVKPSEKPEAKEQEPIKYLIDYLDADTGEEITHEMGVLNPGETINIYKNIDGYEVVTNRSWMPDFNVDYRTMNRHFGFADGRQYTFLRYKKVNADVKPSDTSKPEVKPETKPSETPKPEVKPETKPSETPKPEVKPETKPSETPKPEVKPETKPSETPKPEVKPETKPSDTSKPEVKPEPAPKDEEKQEPLKYRIDYLDADTGEIMFREHGVLNPGETINIHKNIDGYEVVSNYSWMPGFNVDYRIMDTYFGSSDGYLYMFLRYKKVNADAKPSDTPKPEVKPEPKPSDTPKPEVKPETKPSDTSKPEVKPDPKPSETPKPEVKPEPQPSDTSKPEVKPEPKPSETPKPEVKPAPKLSDTSKPEVKPELKPQTNSNTAPTAPVKPVGQTSNSKADKPTSKKETPALPNTGEQSSSLSLVGLLLASLGLAGLTYKGRH